MKEVLVMVSVVVETSVTVEAGMEVVQSCQCLVVVELWEAVVEEGWMEELVVVQSPQCLERELVLLVDVVGLLLELLVEVGFTEELEVVVQSPQ